MLYTQADIDFCQPKTARQLKFMDERGFKVTCDDRNHGHSKKGEQYIEIGRNLAGRNLTLNLLVWCDCVLYFNFVDGPSNRETYLNFWHEASLSQDDFGRPVFFSWRCGHRWQLFHSPESCRESINSVFLGSRTWSTRFFRHIHQIWAQ